MTIFKKKHLEIAIQSIPPHPKPKVELEQYSTPASIAADVLWNAFNLGDIGGKKIADLGCGTGMFAISSLLLGAKKAVGVDIDEYSIEIAKKTANIMGISNYHFLTEDVNVLLEIMDNVFSYLNNNLNENCSYFNNVDTVIQNPPFGSQLKSKKNLDRPFMELASLIAEVTYSFHMKSSENFVINYFNDLGGEITHKFYYKFPIPNIYKFHEMESKNIDVVLLRVESVD
ncbi:METTL5 family protein [Methanobrevibacter filiformis]|uniref:Ribosomal protein L11 methyltransferase n=1 Tax=Methanobrevibacter filiformis TaxID=55758 RepID=A0A165ZHA2_9EURY|nr:ribosomal protein L11 methyltransferase [Methanobrevibacter filiformis]